MSFNRRITMIFLFIGIISLLFRLITFIEKTADIELEIIKNFIFIFLCAFIVFFVCKRDSFISFNKIFIFLFLKIFLLVLIGCTLAYLWYEKNICNNIAISSYSNYSHLIDPNIRYFADGQVDIFAYILYKQGFFFIPYSFIEISEAGIVYFYALLFYIIDNFNIYYIVILNALIKTLTGILIFKIGLRVAGIKTAIFAALFVCFLPEGLLWAGMIHKDNIVTFLVTGIFFSYCKIFLDKNIKYYGLLIILFYALIFIRSGLILPIILLGLILSLLSNNIKNIKINCKFIFYGIFFLLVSLLVLYYFAPIVIKDISNKVYKSINNFLLIGSGIQTSEDILSYTDTKNTSLVEYISTGKLSVKRFFFIPFHILSYYISPFPPFVIREYVDYWVLPSTWIIIFMLPFTFIGFFKFFLDTNLNYRFIAINFLIILLTLAFSGSWVIERYRTISMPMFSIIAFSTLYRIKKTHRLIVLLLMPVFVIILWLIYLLIKYIITN